MIVCSCNAIRERQIREAARAGIDDVEEAYAFLGCQPNCGQCLTFAQQLIDEEACVPA
ncbi:bacterioferritin-associated ferredoxin [Novosphingobium piscinae]|uniref:Bacterioferritin-associated ferredoxin n=1 Tax=Novosphingobium piscinae TaxID=1507448 RepID=A0A7X1FVC0_9SPHN|nr:(2Fe-2S)-binding protein [Novosphingobium piscinae]MBC2667651.1 (2Fe-2S)-binding protein [Novosphingobium piscinae]